MQFFTRLITARSSSMAIATRPLTWWLRQILRIHWVAQEGALFARESSTEVDSEVDAAVIDADVAL